MERLHMTWQRVTVWLVAHETLLLAAGASTVPLQQALSDLHVMVLTNGRERNIDDWRSLLQSANFKLVYCHTMQNSLAIMVAMKA